jgi:hypothetical protein
MDGWMKGRKYRYTNIHIYMPEGMYDRMDERIDGRTEGLKDECADA